MTIPFPQQRTWSDAQLADAVKAASNWRGVMRELGLNAMSAGAIRIVRRDAVHLGLDTSHFRESADGRTLSLGVPCLNPIRGMKSWMLSVWRATAAACEPT
jgi:hypothetical protein